MITVALSATIGAPVDRVWRALTDPEERPLWDERILGRVDSPRNAARDARARALASRAGGATSPPRRRTRWRFRLGAVPLVMQEDLLEEKPNERLVGRVSMGSMQFDQTLTLHREDADHPQTRLGMKLVARNQIAVIGEVVERLDVQKIVIEYVDTTLRQVQKHCEGDA